MWLYDVSEQADFQAGLLFWMLQLCRRRVVMHEGLYSGVLEKAGMLHGGFQVNRRAVAALVAMCALAVSPLSLHAAPINVIARAGVNVVDAISVPTATTFVTVVRGWEFRANNRFTVTHLGWFDEPSPGLTASHEIGIFNASGVLQVSGTVDSSTTLKKGNFLYTPVPLTTLPGNSNYIIAGIDPAALPAALPDGYIAGATAGISYDSNFEFVDARIISFSDLPITSLIFPTVTSPADNQGFIGASFAITPEPSTFVLFTLGMVGMVGYEWRRRKHA